MKNEKTTDDYTLLEQQIYQAVAESFEGLDPTEEQFAEAYENAKSSIVQNRIRAKADYLRGLESAPNYADTIKFADERDPKAAEIQPLIWGIATKGTNNLLIAGTNDGGSTTGQHWALCLLTGDPVFGYYEVVPSEKRLVIWINPEEGEYTPTIRNKQLGLPKHLEDRFLDVWTKPQPFHFNVQYEVDAMVESIKEKFARRGIDISDYEIVLHVDGFDPTLRGKRWGEDVKAWKEGFADFKRQLGIEDAFVRGQFKASASRDGSLRKSNGGEQHASGEDVSGFEIFQWAEHRQIQRKVQAGNRQGPRYLRVRGRQIEEHEFKFKLDTRTWEFKRLDLDDYMVAAMRIKQALRIGTPRNHEFIAIPEEDAVYRGKINKNTLANFLHDYDVANDVENPISFATYRDQLKNQQIAATALEAWRLGQNELG